MSNYLTSHFRGRYRILCEYDKRLNQFPRKLNGTFEDIDCYIICHRGRIYHFGNRILEYYTDSLQRGHNIIKAIESQFQGEEIIFNIVETSSEVLFRFNAKDMERLEPFLKPKTSGADRSPFSTKNLPKTKYTIPNEESLQYKAIVEKIGQKRIIELTHTTNSFLQSLVTKKNTWEDIKADMALKGLSGKNYIHSIGKWNEYISYLERNIK